MTQLLTSIWEFLEPVHSNVYGLVFTLAAGILAYFFRSKVKLIYGRANNSRNVVNLSSQGDLDHPKSTEIYVEKFFLQNTGKRTATNVEFVLSGSPTDVAIWQPRDVTYKRVEKDNCLIQIPQIAPRELVTIDCLYVNQTAAWVSSVKCAESLGMEVPFWTLRRLPHWIYLSVLILLFLGAAFIVQIAFALFSAS